MRATVLCVVGVILGHRWEEFSSWREETKASLDLSMYGMEEVGWARTSFVQPQLMIHDRLQSTLVSSCQYLCHPVDTCVILSILVSSCQYVSMRVLLQVPV